MIQIHKNKEPNQWTEYRKTPGVKYESKPYLVESLLKEQGYICAYCMRRIPCYDEIKEKYRIEHIKPRHFHPHLSLSYKNMVICCPGHIGVNDHCDRKKGDNTISFSPLDKNFIDTICYKVTGIISSSNKKWNSEIENVLNLNDKVLVEARKTMLNETIKKINEAKPQLQWKKKQINKYLEQYKEMHLDNTKKKYHPYCGIVIYYLQKKLRKLP